MRVASTVATRATTVDFDVHGLVRVRLVGAQPGDVAAVERQLGPLLAPVQGDADVVVRFVDRLELDSSLTFVQHGETGFTDDGFVVLRSRSGAPARVLLPMDRIGAGGEIVAERGLPAVPLLLAVTNLIALAHGALPLHATAFDVDGHGVLATGWSKGGKTESLLAFLAAGARYVGDEWVYLVDGGEQMLGVPEPVRLWWWQLQQVPAVSARVPRSTRAALRGLNALTAAVEGAARITHQPASTASVLRRAAPVLRRQLYVQLPPEQLAGGPEGMSRTTRPDTVFFLQSHDDPRTTVQPVDPLEVAARMRWSLRFERAPLTSCYEQFRFAFPDRRSALLDSAAEREEELLQKCLVGRPAFTVRHPYPVRLDELRRAMASCL